MLSDCALQVASSKTLDLAPKNTGLHLIAQNVSVEYIIKQHSTVLSSSGQALPVGHCPRNCHCQGSAVEQSTQGYTTAHYTTLYYTTPTVECNTFNYSRVQYSKAHTVQYIIESIKTHNFNLFFLALSLKKILCCSIHFILSLQLKVLYHLYFIQVLILTNKSFKVYY